MSSVNADLYLSNGTCYFGAGQAADSHFIACGNAYLGGPQACCYAGDYCLSSNTCWDAETVVTYIAGCTDPLFRADVCPQRNNYPDQQWVALARCDGDDIDLWTGCALHPDDIQIEKENCDCNKSNVLIQNPNGKDSFDEIGLLPNNTLEAIAFNPTVTPSPLVTGGSGGGLSTGAKAGIGVGVTIAGLLVLAGAAFLYLRRRRQQRDGAKVEMDGSTQYGSHRGSDKSELSGDNNAHRGFSTGTAGQMSELSPQREILEIGSSRDYHERAEMESPGEFRERSELESTSGSNTVVGSSTSPIQSSTSQPDIESGAQRPGRKYF